MVELVRLQWYGLPFGQPATCLCVPPESRYFKFGELSQQVCVWWDKAKSSFLKTSAIKINVNLTCIEVIDSLLGMTQYLNYVTKVPFCGLRAKSDTEHLTKGISRVGG